MLFDEVSNQAKSKSARSIWARPFLLRRNVNDVFHIFFQELRKKDSDSLKAYVKMDANHLDLFVRTQKISISKQDNTMRECIKEEE